MRKLSVLLIALLLCAAAAACNNSNVPVQSTPIPPANTTAAPSAAPSAPVPTDGPETNEPEREISVNKELISLAGQPLKFFTEEFGVKLEDLEMFYEGPPVGECTVGETTYVFNNYLGYDDLTEETPCTAIHTRYTVLLPGIEQGALTEELLVKLFGPHIEEFDNINVYQYEGVNLIFMTGEDGKYDDIVRISKVMSWG